MKWESVAEERAEWTGNNHNHIIEHITAQSVERRSRRRRGSEALSFERRQLNKEKKLYLPERHVFEN